MQLVGVTQSDDATQLADDAQLVNAMQPAGSFQTERRACDCGSRPPS